MALVTLAPLYKLSHRVTISKVNVRCVDRASGPSRTMSPSESLLTESSFSLDMGSPPRSPHAHIRWPRLGLELFWFPPFPLCDVVEEVLSEAYPVPP